MRLIISQDDHLTSSERKGITALILSGQTQCYNRLRTKIYIVYSGTPIGESGYSYLIKIGTRMRSTIGADVSTVWRTVDVKCVKPQKLYKNE
jgi:hypothetical protein